MKVPHMHGKHDKSRPNKQLSCTFFIRAGVQGMPRNKITSAQRRGMPSSLDDNGRHTAPPTACGGGGQNGGKK